MSTSTCCSRLAARVTRLAFAALTIALAGAESLAAQAAARTDVIRGRVIGPDTMPIAGAQVMAVDTVAKSPKPARTDARGAFSITFENGSGVYMVAVSMLGYAPQRRTVTRGADGTIPVLEFKMSQVAAQLGAVRSVGERPKTVRSDAQGDGSVGGQTSFVNTNGLSGDFTGDLTLALATLPGVTLIPSATGGLPTVSAFGVSGDQNGLLLNGMGFGAQVPRDGFRVGVVTSSYDPSRGGFAGIQTTLRMVQGTNMIQSGLHATVDAPSLQWTTPIANRLQTRYQQQIFSGSLSGPVVTDHVFYSTSFQLQRRSSGLTSLASADPASLAALRISPDSVARLLALLGPAGIPANVTGVPAARLNTETRLAARIDWIPHPAPPTPGIVLFNNNATQDAYYLQAGGTFRDNDGAMIGPTSVPSFGGEQKHRDGWAQFTAAKYLPKSILNETTISVSGSTDRTAPYLDLPAARILIASTLPNGEPGLSTLQVGGNSQPRSESQAWQSELRSQFTWNTWDRRHSLSVTATGAVDGFTIDQDAGYGSFTFNSLADFTAGLPASYSRTLTGRSSSGRAFSGALGIGDTYVTRSPSAPAPGATPPPTIQYGVRIEGNHFDVRPAYNPQIESTFGLRTDHVPSTLAVMPMLGFRAFFMKPVSSPQGIFFGPRMTVSGGIREYRGTLAARAIDSYTRQTGLPDGIRQLYCVGAATPSADWRGFDGGNVPTECANGAASLPLAQSTPPVALFSRDYRLFESWRPQLNVDYQISTSWRGQLSGTYTFNRNQPGIYDVNFQPTERFTLPAEGNRPVYVSPSSIVPATGAQAWVESRVSPLFAHVAETRSDLRSETRTIGGSLSYGTFLFGVPGNSWFTTLGYTFSDSREQYRGFLGTTSGNPTEKAWARGQQARHVVTMNITRRIDRLGSATLFGRMQSGMAYTPLVVGDINGDGYSNDRAYVFNPATIGDTSIANPINRLMQSSSGSARTCLTRQLGNIAGRNSCVGPWAFTNLSLQIQPDAYRVRLGNRGSVSLFVNNILSGLDQAVHGSEKLHGWGQPAFPDATLLTVRGFDPTAKRFTYAVNPQFGNTAVFRNTFRQPFMLTIDFRMDVAPDRETQMLSALLAPRKADNAKVLNEAQIKQRIMRGFNPVDQMILVKDSLKFTDAQIDSMRKIGQRFLVARDSIATQVARFLAGRNGDYRGSAVREVWHSAGIATYTVFFHTMKNVIAIFTPEQREKSRTVPQTAGVLIQFENLKESDLPYLFRSPLPSLP